MKLIEHLGDRLFFLLYKEKVYISYFKFKFMKNTEYFDIKLEYSIDYLMLFYEMVDVSVLFL